MKRFYTLLLGLMMIAGVTTAQQTSLIQPKTTRIIGKLDLYWSAVVIADSFPSFFPLELEINFPSPRISLEAIVSPWIRNYSTGYRNYHEKSFSGGIGLRYYPFKGAFPEAATGFFVEPQFLMRYSTADIDSLGVITGTVKSFNGGPFLGIGYQHAFLDWLYLQGRVSVGKATDDAFRNYRLGSGVTVLPWIGIGFGLH